MKNEYYQVRPRWSAGSPAQVPQMIAESVARDERDAHVLAAEGAFGPEIARAAQELPYALRGIVEFCREYPDGWLVIDLLTDEVCFRFAERRDRKPPTWKARQRAHDLVMREMRTCGFNYELEGELR